VDEEIRWALSLEPDALFVEFGRRLDVAGDGISSPDPDWWLALASEWLDEHLPDLRRRICAHPRTQAFIERDADYDLPAASLLAVIIVRGGLAGWCAGIRD
jgi:hypothetical protein